MHLTTSADREARELGQLESAEEKISASGQTRSGITFPLHLLNASLRVLIAIIAKQAARPSAAHRAQVCYGVALGRCQSEIVCIAMCRWIQNLTHG